MNSQIATILSFTLPCLLTTMGAALIFFFKKPSKLLTLITIGLSGGIMLSASIWSLLLPAFENAEKDWGKLSPIPVSLGFVFGGLLMIFLDFLCKKLFKNNEKMQKPFKFFTAMTIHNVPEGLAVGVAIGTAIATNSSIFAAFMFALGIAIQNFPEGLATAIPLHKFLKNEKQSFFFAFLSGVVEPIFAIIGYFLAKSTTLLLPWLLSLSAGSMIYVVVEELMPELKENELSFIGPIMFLFGFLIMMLLDVCL